MYIPPPALQTPDAHSDRLPLNQTQQAEPTMAIGSGTTKLTIIIYLTALASKLTGWAAFVWLQKKVSVCPWRVNKGKLVPGRPNVTLNPNHDNPNMLGLV